MSQSQHGHDQHEGLRAGGRPGFRHRAAPGDGSAVRWLAGDHHVHTQYSADGVYRVIDQARHARAYGLDWLVITDHGGPQHSRIGVDAVHPEIVAARAELPDLLIFQGLEWNIPNAEHGTVFVSPGPNEVTVLKEFERVYDGSRMPATHTAEENEERAVAGIAYLGGQVRRRHVEAALMLANHPSHRGLDSPHELRAWRDADPSVAIGMEGAPGHQAGGIPKPHGFGGARGYYYLNPTAASFRGFPLDAYRSWGGFDWMTSTVGGLWDSMLAEGRPWWITANSDAHTVHLDHARQGPGSDFAANGRNDDPVYSPQPVVDGDFWPGFYSRTHVGATEFGYRAVMDGLRSGRVWVDHGGLVDSVDARVRVAGGPPGSGAVLGGALTARRGTPVELALEIELPTTPNWAQFVPELARVDLIRGAVTGPAADRDSFVAPRTRVIASFEVRPGDRKLSVRFDLGRVDEPYYVRLRGTDGNRSRPGLLGADVDPCGPAMDVDGDQDPWTDLWFYANPIWVFPE
ncbi:PHP domain-containing protein [Streptomyces olivaceus]|uniref:PHP domain-containing protein n=1 Tax=Streptomyces olivaceus TaxID=47716 RepID=UPI001CCEFF84|nr:PHP domain-containing protein [Streptomyces olivaceus]